MKSVLLSTRPKWCEKICHEIGTDKNGKPIYEKTIEVRKTKPSTPTPFKCFIYCTKAKSQWRYSDYEGEIVYAQQYIIGEFICDKVDEYKFHNRLINFNSMGLPSGVYGSYLIFEDEYKSMCLSYDEVKNYGKGKTLYGWHISQLKIYNTPKELSEFSPICSYKNDDGSCQCRKVDCLYQQRDYNTDGSVNLVTCGKSITRPPQSYMYVEEV